MPSTRIVFGLSIAAASLAAVPAIAQPMGWGGPGYPYRYGGRGTDPRQNKVNVATFKADGAVAGALGHGGIAVTQAPGSMEQGPETDTYEAAIADQLGKAGYDISGANDAETQVAELVITHDVVQPEEPPHSPVSGAMGVGLGNRGHAVDMAIGIDLTKPLKALVATRLDARIRDKATNALLWEGHAQIITREGDKHWTDEAIANRLSAALFKDFPNRLSM